jgi:hypothetical protein
MRLKNEMRRVSASTERNGNTNDALGAQFAFLIGSDRRPAIVRRRSPTARMAYVRRAVAFCGRSSTLTVRREIVTLLP